LSRLTLLTTGGTIAGTGNPDHYQAATLGAQALFASVPQLLELADWQIEEIFSLDSRDLHPSHWITLAARVQTLLADPLTDGIVITHGTDTLEETAFALHLLLRISKPVVLTAAMRPADSTDADGPENLFQASCVALDVQSAAHGVLVVANGLIVRARDIRKTHTSAIAALCNGMETAPAGYIDKKHITLGTPDTDPFAARLAFPLHQPLPRVDILYACAGVSADLPLLCVDAGAQGLVLALSGHGSIPEVWREPLALAMRRGVTVIRGSRIPDGGVLFNHNESDRDFGTLAAGHLSPQQARVLLILGLAADVEASNLFSLAG